jgi:membrane protein implicated in regulation of membrane protease activity
MHRNSEIRFPLSVLTMLLLLGLIVGPMAATGDATTAIKVSLFLIVEVVVCLIIRAAMKAHGAQERHAFRRALLEFTSGSCLFSFR